MLAKRRPSNLLMNWATKTLLVFMGGKPNTLKNQKGGLSLPSETAKDSNSELLRRLTELEMENDELKKSLGEKSLIIHLNISPVE